MTANIIYRGMVRTVNFPMNGYQLRDLSDKMRNDFPITVRIDELFKDNAVSCEVQIVSFDDMNRLNLFVQRVDDLCEADEAKMFALMNKYPKAEISELLDMTYGLDSIDTYICCNNDDLAELALSNEWLPEFENCSYEILEYLDKDAVADEVKLQREGYVYNDCYVEPNSYTRPKHDIELPPAATGFFRLLLAADRENKIPDRDKAEWLTLPCSKSELTEFEKRLGCPMSKTICLGSESALPMIEPNTITQTNISELNDLAHKLSELDNDEIIKLKAVMELGSVNSIYRTIKLADHLSEFDFDPNPNDASVYGKIYLHNTLPQGFNTEIFATADMDDFGRSILSAKGGMMTSYGAVSGRGQELYAPIYQEQEQIETEDETEEPGACLT